MNDKLFVAFRQEQEIELKPENKKIKVAPAFIVPEDNKNFVNSAKNWATTYDREARKSVCGKDNIILNNPTSIRIVGLSYRSSGGRAYKVIYPPNYLVDLREDILLDVIYHSSISNGVPDCKFIWASVGGQMKLIRVNSQLHKYVIEKHQTSKLSLISKDKLEEGCLYVGKANNSIGLYLGEISTILFNYKLRELRSWREFFIDSIKQKKVNGFLWYDPCSSQDNKNLLEDTKNYFNDYLFNGKFRGRFEITKNNTKMRRCIGKIELEDDIVGLIKETEYNRVFENNRELLLKSDVFSKHSSDMNFCRSSYLINMVNKGENPKSNLSPFMIDLFNSYK